MSALQFYLCLCCARFALLKTGHSNKNLSQKGLKIELFLQKTQKLFCVSFLRLPFKVTNLNTSPMPPSPFWKFFIKYIEQWTKTFYKKTGWPGRSETGQPAGRPAGQPTMILKFTGRVEKILTGSISATDILLPLRILILLPRFAFSQIRLKFVLLMIVIF